MQAIVYKISYKEGYVVQHREYSQYFVVISGVEALKIVNHYIAELQLI